MLESKRGIGDIISTITVTVLFVVILSLVVFAARGYQHASEVQNVNSNTRAVGSYVVNCVKDSNTSEVAVENISGTDCLVIRSSDGYEHRIFMSGGKLMEEYVEAGLPLDPETALEIGKMSEIRAVGDKIPSMTAFAAIAPGKVLVMSPIS